METATHDNLVRLLNEHRNEAMITCAESCWCWDVEKAIMKIEDEFIKEYRIEKSNMIDDYDEYLS